MYRNFGEDEDSGVVLIDQKVPTGTDTTTQTLEEVGKAIDNEKAELIKKGKTYTTLSWIFGSLSVVFLTIIILQLYNKKRR